MSLSGSILSAIAYLLAVDSGLLLYLGLGIGGLCLVAVIIAIVVGILHHIKHPTLTYFESMLNQGLEDMRQFFADIEPGEEETAEPADVDEQSAAQDTALGEEAQPAEMVEGQEPNVQEPAQETQAQPTDSVQCESEPQPESEAKAEPIPAAPAAPTEYADVPQPVAEEEIPASAEEVEWEELTQNEVEHVDVAVIRPEDEMLTRMVQDDGDDLDVFDFDSDFDEFDFTKDEGMVPEQESIAGLAQMGGDTSWAEEEEDVEEGEDAEAEDMDDMDFEEGEAGNKSLVNSRYRRSFRAKLIQSSDQVKEYYTALYNELLGYKKMRVNADMNAFSLGRRTYCRMAIAGKTLCVYLALNPKSFDPNIFHHRNKGNVRKFEATPMMMRVRSNLSLRRTLSLILYMAGRYTQFQKNMAYEDVDLSETLAYRTDEELLQLGLIKSNAEAVQVDTVITAQDRIEHDEYLDSLHDYVDLRPIKQSQIGNISSGDIANMRAKIESEARRSPNASDTGKFVEDTQNGQYRFLLYSPQGDLLYASKMYNNPYLVDRAVEAFRDMVKKETPVVLYRCEGKYYFAARVGNVVYRFPDYPTKIACLDAQAKVLPTVNTAVLES